MRLAAGLPSGVEALLFEAAETRRGLETIFEAELERAGYREMVLPVLDYAEPYDTLLSSAQRGRLYRFVDRQGAMLALRSDFTPMVARLLAPRLPSLELPLRLFYRGDVVRSDEGPAGRRHELYQMGVELLGPAADQGDEEVLTLGARLLSASGARGTQIVLGGAGLLDALLLEVGGARAAELAAQMARRERAAAGASAVLAEIIADGCPRDSGGLGPVGATRLKALEALVEHLATTFPTVRFSIDLAEFALFSSHPALAASEPVEGYYDGVVFRAYAGQRARAVGAGGRYDRLFDRLGARLPAAGFSFTVDALAAESVEEV